MTATNYSTAKQLAILDLLYKFRFATSEQLSQSLNITQATINKRLKILLDRGYVGRNYDASYRLQRKHASYYLLSAGARHLRLSNGNYSLSALRNITNDKSASEQFITHNLAIFDTYSALRMQYAIKLKLFTKHQLTAFEHFPQPLPDAYIRIETDHGERQFFVEVFHEAQPFFVATRKIMRYVAFANVQSIAWEQATNTTLPDVLLFCDTQSLHRRLQKKMQRAALSIEDEIRMFVHAPGNELYDLANPDNQLTLAEIV